MPSNKYEAILLYSGYVETYFSQENISGNGSILTFEAHHCPKHGVRGSLSFLMKVFSFVLTGCSKNVSFITWWVKIM